MTRLDVSQTMSRPVAARIDTCAAEAPLLSNSETQENREAWDKAIDQQIIEWATNFTRLEDDGIDPPDGDIIALACEIARTLRDSGLPAPLRVVPNGDGGITFEHMQGRVFETIEIERDASVEHCVFEDSKLTLRQRLK